MGCYAVIPCSQCQACQLFRFVEGYGSDICNCEKHFEPKTFSGTSAQWDVREQGTYPETCYNFKRINPNSNSNSNSNSEKQRPSTFKSSQESYLQGNPYGNEGCLIIVFSFVSAFGYVRFVWSLIKLITGVTFSSIILRIVCTVIVSIGLVALRDKKEKLGKILGWVGLLLLVIRIVWGFVS